MRLSRIASILPFLAFLALPAGPPALAAGSDYLNFQGVLRRADGTPQNGSTAMTFSFFSAETGGDEILVDDHSSIAIDHGLFTVSLGSGTVTDGAGPGTYTELPAVFAAYAEVYLEIDIKGEILTPRIRLHAAAWAHDAGSLEGRSASEFVDTTSTPQSKLGPLVVDASAMTTSVGVEGTGTDAGGYFHDSDGTGYVYAGQGNYGLKAYGSLAGGYFKDTNQTGYAYVGRGDYGIMGYGNTAGGYFKDADQSGYAYVGNGDYGIQAHGFAGGGTFQDQDGTAYAYAAEESYGIRALGDEAGGYFLDQDGTGYAYVGYGDYGIQGFGSSAGGHFKDDGASGYANVGTGNYGIMAYGSTTGGYFKDSDDSGYANVGYHDYGIRAFGNIAGGYFKDLTSTSYGSVGSGVHGVYAVGSDTGGYFTDSGGTAWARLGSGNAGIEAEGKGGGALFGDFDEDSGAAIASGGDGISAWGDFRGGSFSHATSGNDLDVAGSTYSLSGNGAKNFVQNHPFEPANLIVYTSLEGDEVGTYTRGTARLVGGEARVTLGETFQWVTSPDIGLTAQVTPRGSAVPLAVLSLSTTELVVAGPEDVVFDYTVQGLRVGFEELSAVRPKAEGEEAYLPSFEANRELLEKDPGLRAHTALERFRIMEQESGGRPSVDLEGSATLVAAIGTYDPERHGRPADRFPGIAASRGASEGDLEEEIVVGIDGLPSNSGHSGTHSSVGESIEQSGRSEDLGIPQVPEYLATEMSLSTPAEAGDLLGLDHQGEGRLRPTSFQGDPSVIGVATSATESGEAGFMTTVAVHGVVTVKADASYGRILPGDLLESSPTPGHAMRAADPATGVVVARALEGLEVGTGTIRVLIVGR
jgi:hypothetical protein